jgi:hypothetical protein
MIISALSSFVATCGAEFTLEIAMLVGGIVLYLKRNVIGFQRANDLDC